MKQDLAHRRDHGAAAVETALMLPLLLLVVFGIMDFGLLLNNQIAVTEAAREGARAAAIDPADPGAAQDRVDRINSSYTVDAGASTLCPVSPGAADDAVIVVSYRYDWLTPVGAVADLFSGDDYGTGITITGKGVMPCRA